jgi:hypothetical protein
MSSSVLWFVYSAVILGGVFITYFFRWSFGERKPPRVVLEQEERHPYRQVEQKETTRTCDRCGAEWVTKRRP